MESDVLEDLSIAIEPMLNNGLDNYIVPGVSSFLVGGGDHGKVRLFVAGREARDFVTPHSHRFDFTCLVLHGIVHNTIFKESPFSTSDEWCISTIDQVCGANGIREYKHVRESSPTRFNQETTTYRKGETYSMTYDEIHSIVFGRGTKVLFFESPEVTKRSRMIEPWVNGQVVPTFKTESWMFQNRSALEFEASAVS